MKSDRDCTSFFILPSYICSLEQYLEIDNRRAVQLWNPHHNNFAKVQKDTYKKYQTPSGSQGLTKDLYFLLQDDST